MRRTLLAAAVLSTLAVPGIALAEDSPHSFTGNVGIFSQYIFRGLAQTNEDPALQGGLDYGYNFGAGTVYVGAWGSNVSWPKENFTTPTGLVQGQYSSGGSLELDLYAGVKGNFGKSDFTYDVGGLYYWYPGDTTTLLPAGGVCTIGPFTGCPKADTFELYGAVGWKWLSAKYSYSLGDTFGWPEADGTWYLDLSAAIPIAETGLTLGLHWGMQEYDGTIPGTAVSYDELLSYKDWRVSLAYDLGKVSKTLTGVEIGAMYTDTSSANACGYGKFTQVGTIAGAACNGVYPKDISDGQFTAWLKKTF